jgi:hypothetical protein
MNNGDNKMTNISRQTVENMTTALQEAYLQIQYLHEKFGSTGTGETTLSRIRSALNEVESSAYPKITAQNIRDLIGRQIVFKDAIHDHEVYTEPHMKATVVSVAKQDEDLFKITVNYSLFEEHNKTFESSNYYDKNGTPRLTAREAGFYNVCETIYFDSPDADPWEKYFEVL